ncbi:MAG: hypothetical protein WDL87_00655 [Candidatus Omnitrophota bacterium]|jgi:hypothetical protein
MMKIPKLEEIRKIITRLSKREKMVLYAAIAVLSLTAMDRLMVSPFLSKMKSLDSDIQKKEKEIKNALHVLGLKNRITAEILQYASYVGGTQSEEEQVTLLLKEIEVLTSKSSVYLIDMKPAGAKNIGSCVKYMVTVNIEAAMDKLIDFMYIIESSSKLLTIQKYQISPKTEGSNVAKCTMTIFKTVIQ